MRYFAPEYLLTPQGLSEPWQAVLGVNEGKILSLVRSVPPGSEVTVLPDVALLPGFVNTHSHVFQRSLRGRTHRPLSAQDTFWTWRNAMYAAAQQLEPDTLYEQARQTFREMLQAGYTTVGEFHYVHHQTSGQPYDRQNAMAEALLAAAQESGIRLVLLMTAYTQGNFFQGPSPAQLRFCDSSVDAYLQRVDALRSAGYAIGLAPHSIRALTEEWLREIVSYSTHYQLPLHIHASEQMQEVEQCQAIYGRKPIEQLAAWGVLTPLTTVIHATHASDHEIALMQQHGVTVCVCPTTEGDLGDGIAPYGSLRNAVTLSIGSDSNTRLDPFEELRWAEYSARMRYQQRRIIIDQPQASPATLLHAMGTRGGAHALRKQLGSLEPSYAADFIAIDLKHPMLAGWQPETLLETLIFGASSEVIKQTWVAGKSVAQRYS